MYNNVHTHIQVNPVAQWWPFDSVKKIFAIKETLDSPHAVAGSLPSKSVAHTCQQFNQTTAGGLDKEEGGSLQRSSKTSKIGEKPTNFT